MSLTGISLAQIGSLCKVLKATKYSLLWIKQIQLEKFYRNQFETVNKKQSRFGAADKPVLTVVLQDAMEELNGRSYDGRDLRISMDAGRPPRKYDLVIFFITPFVILVFLIIIIFCAVILRHLSDFGGGGFGGERGGGYRGGREDYGRREYDRR